MTAFTDFLATSTRIILDGATGTELTRRGVDTGLPLWSANALLSDEGQSVLKEIHADYLKVGANIITSNTFRTHRRVLAPSGNAERGAELTRIAVDIARQALSDSPGDQPCFVAGSISTLEDCYRPDLVPTEDACRLEHSERIHHLIGAGIDLLLIETMNSVREAAIAAQIGTGSGVPVVVSFVCDPYGRILSGETLSEAVKVIMPMGPTAIGVNCGPTPSLIRPLEELREACGPDFPLIAYGNIGFADEKKGWVITDAEDPEQYCNHASRWPARIIGGCCGTTPEHIARLHRLR